MLQCIVMLPKPVKAFKPTKKKLTLMSYSLSETVLHIREQDPIQQNVHELHRE